MGRVQTVRCFISNTSYVLQEVASLPSDPTEPQLRKIMAKHNMADNGGVPLFNFCINPKSFGQTVENFFYISFLIKEGKVGLDFDEDEWPTLGMVESERTVEKRQETQRNQAVFTLDFEKWEDLVHGLGIKKSIIPHRKDDEFLELNLTYRDREEENVQTRQAASSPTGVVRDEGNENNEEDDDDEEEDMYGPS